MASFTARNSAVLTSTTSSQTVTVPNGSTALVAYNGGANPVYMKWGASVTVPAATFDGTAVWTMVVQPTSTRIFSMPPGGGTLAYIASTAGGSLILAIGDGE